LVTMCFFFTIRLKSNKVAAAVISIKSKPTNPQVGFLPASVTRRVLNLLS